MEYEDFKEFGLTRDDFKIDVYNRDKDADHNTSAIEVSIPIFKTSVKSWNYKTQIENLDDCLAKLWLILKKATEMAGD